MIEVGRICVKVAGRDAGLKCVVVDILDKNLVLIDGQTRRRKCNIAHLEPLAQTLPVEKGASHEKVVSAFKELGVEIVERKPKAKAPAQKIAPRAVPKTAPVAKPVAKKPARADQPAKPVLPEKKQAPAEKTE